jgi:HK97 family phage prohead protease
LTETPHPPPGHGNGLKMTLELRDLRKRHNLQVVDPKPMPPLPPLDAPHGVLIKALASDSSIDLDRGKFRPGGIKFDPDHPPKLILRHDPSLREVGTIHDIEYRPNGDLVIDAIVFDPIAATMPGLSIGCDVRKFALHEGADPHGEVEEGVLTEISLVEQPANPKCIVKSRRPAEPFDLALLGWRRSIQEGYDLMRKQLDVIGQMAAEVDKQLRNAPKAPPAAPARQRYTAREWAVGDRINLDAQFVADAGVEDGTIKGVASAPGVDAYGHVVAAHSFTASIQRKGLHGPRGVKFLAFHDWQKPAGIIKKLETDARGQLQIEAQLNLNVSYVRDLWAIAKQNGGLSFSVGFILQDFELVDEKSSKQGESMIITRGDLLEVSIVLAPAQPDSVMTFVNQRPAETLAEFEKGLIADGFVSSRNEAQRVVELAKKHIHLLS